LFEGLKPDIQLALAIVIAVLGFFFIIYIVDRIVEYIRFRKLLKHPEYLKMKAEAEALKQRQRFAPPVLIPRKVKVMVLREDQILEDICRYDGEVVRCPRLDMMFVVPTTYRPYVSLIGGKKMSVTLLFDDAGRAIRIENNADKHVANAVVPDPVSRSPSSGRGRSSR
jgi:hypothetical protein